MSTAAQTHHQLPSWFLLIRTELMWSFRLKFYRSLVWCNQSWHADSTGFQTPHISNHSEEPQIQISPQIVGNGAETNWKHNQTEPGRSYVKLIQLKLPLKVQRWIIDHQLSGLSLNVEDLKELWAQWSTQSAHLSLFYIKCWRWDYCPAAIIVSVAQGNR